MNILGLIFYYLIGRCHSLIVPNEIPTILSILYSNVPPIKVGFDSRFGYGFRLGPHADFQSIVELGPQTNTNPLSTNGTVAKRQSFTLNRIQRLYNDALKKAGRKVDKVPQQKKTDKEKKAQKITAESVEPKKVSGIDESVGKVKLRNNLKQMKLNSESLPTKFSLLK